MNKARITYRFDDPGRDAVRKEPKPVIPLFKEEFTVVEDDRAFAADIHAAEQAWPNETPGRTRRDFIDTQPLNQFTTDFGAWKSPFEAETEKVERMIRESSGPRQPERHPERHPEPIPGQERFPVEREARYDGHTGYYGPEETERQHGARGDGYVPTAVIHGRYERHNRTPWLKIVASVSGAVATGVLIGFFVLSMFGGDELPGSQAGTTGSSGKSASTVPVQTKTPAADPSGAKDNSAPASSAAAATVSVNIAAQSYTLLQNGVFSNQQGADAAAAELRKKGLAAHVQQSDKYYVYAGMAPSHDDALALSNVLKEQKMELFLKGLTLPAATKIKWTGDSTGPAEQFFAQSHTLVQTIGNFAAARLKEKTPSAIDDKTLQTIHTAHQAWTGASGPFGAGLAQEQKAALQKWTTAMNTAVTSMDEYKKNQSSAFLWEAQSSLMQVLFAENELLAAIKAQ
ncbi:MAG: sporulation protein, partial [Paenibacillus sp.]|jgi:stage II sporulation protein B|nr:sporulation protein [Paenibacillus sp.]